MCWRLTAFVTFLVSLTPGFGLEASAQTTGTLSGIVRDSSGAALPGVAVTARNVDTELVRSDVTGADPMRRIQVGARLSF